MQSAPLLFQSSITDLPKHTNRLKSVLYADGTIWSRTRLKCEWRIKTLYCMVQILILQKPEILKLSISRGNSLLENDEVWDHAEFPFIDTDDGFKWNYRSKLATIKVDFFVNRHNYFQDGFSLNHVLWYCNMESFSS